MVCIKTSLALLLKEQSTLIFQRSKSMEEALVFHTSKINRDGRCSDCARWTNHSYRAIDFIYDELADAFLVWWAQDDHLPDYIWDQLDLGVRRRLQKHPKWKSNPKVLDFAASTWARSFVSSTYLYSDNIITGGVRQPYTQTALLHQRWFYSQCSANGPGVLIHSTNSILKFKIWVNN